MRSGQHILGRQNKITHRVLTKAGAVPLSSWLLTQSRGRSAARLDNCGHRADLVAEGGRRLPLSACRLLENQNASGYSASDHGTGVR